MCTSLKVTPHPRGHIASCNGRVETIEAWVEPVDVLSCPTCVSQRAAQVQKLTQQEREKRLAKLAKFRKDVNKRVRQVGKNTEQEVYAKTAVKSPPKPAFNSALSHVVVAHNPEDDAVLVEKATEATLAQQARSSLVALVCSPQAVWKKTETETTQIHLPTENSLEEQGSRSHYKRNTLTFHRFQEEPRLTGSPLYSSQSSPPSHLQTTPTKSPDGSVPITSAQMQTSPVEPSCCLPHCNGALAEEDSKGHERCIVVAPGKLEHNQKVQAQRQRLTVRRLWSKFEREQARQAQHQRKEHLYVAQLKLGREAERKLQEDEIYLDTLDGEKTEDRERAEQWAALMASEEQRHKLTKAKENERFIEALREKVKQRMIQKHSQLPALCSCARTFWETDPNTCANNCIFYKNETAYAKALWSLMVSLELQ